MGSLKSCSETMKNGRIPTPKTASYFSEILYLWYSWSRRGCDRMVVEFIATCAISAYHHKSCEFEPRSWRGVLYTTPCYNVCQ